MNVCVFHSVLDYNTGVEFRDFSQLKYVITINLKMFVDNTMSCFLRKVK